MDKKEILEALGGIPEDVYDSIVVVFYEETRAKIEPLKSAIAAKDALAVAKIGHGIKGSAANLRLTEISEIGQKLEIAGKTGNVTSFQECLDELLKLMP